MNKNLKRILPILLGIVIIASMIWYLFVYDRDFTRDSLLGSARFFENRGDHRVAAWLYDVAYHYSGSDETVAIELAQHFIEDGNYTQAEITLSNAIAESASARLYIALCSTYVAQDKLLDAVTMLDNITDPVIREQITAQRPAAPTADPAPNFYSQYVPVTIQSGGGNLYLTTDGSYPSTKSAPSDGSVSLEAGENIIYALSVGADGLVSPLSIFGYTISGVIEEVVLTDPAIDAAVRQVLGFDETDVILSSDLWTITDLTLPEGADSYKELYRLPYLQQLHIQGGSAASLDGLASLSSLTELSIRDTFLETEDLKTIASLPNLRRLTLSGCSISGIAPLGDAEHLEYLDLSQNSIGDFTALSFLSSLEYLDLSHNGLSSLNAASGLSSLQTLKVSHNALISMAPLAGCTQLQELDISNNQITGLSGVEQLIRLQTLNASFNQLTDVTPLSGCASLKDLNISNNELTDITCLAGLKGLEFLNFSRNHIMALPNWGADCALITIDGSNNLITSLAALSGYGKLNYVLMDYNNIVWVDGLVTCPNLIKVSVFGNPVSDVSALLEQSIIVNYNPLG